MGTEVLDRLDKFNINLGENIARLSEVQPKTAETSPVTGPVEEKTETAELEQKGIVSGVSSMEVWGVPIGDAAVGTFGGVFFSELVDGFMAAQPDMVRGIIKLGAAGVTAKWLKRFIGVGPSKAITFALAILGLSQVLPVDKWARDLAEAVAKIKPGTLKVSDSNPRGNGSRTGDYYARAFGR